MTISMYQASVPRLVNALNNLSNVLGKAQAHIEAKKLDPKTLLEFRLFPDMLHMTRQVQIASDTAKGVVARLAGIEIPAYEDNEQSVADLQAGWPRRLPLSKACRQPRLTAPKTRPSSSSAATKRRTTQVCSFCWAMPCPTSTSTRP